VYEFAATLVMVGSMWVTTRDY